MGHNVPLIMDGAEKFALVSLTVSLETGERRVRATESDEASSTVFEMNLKYFTYMRPMRLTPGLTLFNFEAREVRQILSTVKA